MSEQPTARLDSSPALPTDGWLGRIVADRYRVLEKLGEGGMGVVYVAEHLTLQKKVALKLIHPHWAANAELLARFKREAVSTAHLEHPHIVAAQDFGELPDGSAFMVMPWVRGRSLSHEIDTQGRMDFRRAARLGAQLADALAAAHSIGIVHRDLKPDNVLLESRSDGSEAARILDFGIASLSGDSGALPADVAQPLTRLGSVLGTPGYMSPEQAAGAEIDARTDLYALGVMLWEMCQGRLLFPGEDFHQILSQQLAGPAPALELGPSPEARELAALVAQLIELDKSKRPGSASEVQAALRRIGDAQLAFAQSATVAAPSGSPPAVQAARLSAAGAAYARTASTFVQGAPRRYKMLAAAVGAWLLVALAALTFGGDEAPEADTGTAAAADVKEERDESAGLVAEAGETLLAAQSRDSQRRAAAREIRKHADAAPAYLVHAAELELTSRCSDKKELVAKLRELADPRVLPALERMADQPKRGCGLVRLNDCLGCLRRELADTIEALKSE